MRLAEARSELLIVSPRSVVADRSLRSRNAGRYESEAAFSRAFKRRFGVPPRIGQVLGAQGIVDKRLTCKVLLAYHLSK